MRAQFFVSHAWAASWGDLVVACATMLPAGAIVWIDIFAVRQWPGNAVDLAFHAVVKRCACGQTTLLDFSPSSWVTASDGLCTVLVGATGFCS